MEIRACQPCERTICQGVEAAEEHGIRQLQEEQTTDQIVAVQEKPFTFSEQVRLNVGQGEPVQLAAIEVLGRVGDDSVVTRMRWLLGKTPEEKKGLKDALHHAILGIEQRK